MAFGGVSLSCLLSLLPVGKRLLHNAPWPKPWQFAVIYGELFVIIIVAIFLAGVPVIQELQAGTFGPANPPPDWALCEWLLLFSAIIWAVGLVLISPNSLIKEQNYE
jgi:hypothetical protein